MEAYVWAATDAHEGVVLSTRVFGSIVDAINDAQEAIGDACPVTWTMEDGMEIADPEFASQFVTGDVLGGFTDTEGRAGYVKISLVKVSL